MPMKNYRWAVGGFTSWNVTCGFELLCSSSGVTNWRVKLFWIVTLCWNLQKLFLTRRENTCIFIQYLRLYFRCSISCANIVNYICAIVFDSKYLKLSHLLTYLRFLNVQMYLTGALCKSLGEIF